MLYYKYIYNIREMRNKREQYQRTYYYYHQHQDEHSAGDEYIIRQPYAERQVFYFIVIVLNIFPQIKFIIYLRLIIIIIK